MNPKVTRILALVLVAVMILALVASMLAPFV